MIKYMAMEKCTGQMEQLIKETGQKVSSMAMA